MKKTKVILWIVGALFLVSSIPIFAQGDIAAGVCGVAIAAALFFVGYRKGAASEEHSTSPPPFDKSTYKVYVEEGGQKYHRNKTCSGMKKPSYIPMKDAENRGYTKCKKCFR